MEDMYSQMSREATEIADDFRQEIRESNHGLLKLAGIELIPIAMGASFGGIGRATGEHWIPAVPALLSGQALGSIRGIWGLTKYGIGVALPYADKIYSAIQENLPSIYSAFDSLIDKF